MHFNYTKEELTDLRRSLTFDQVTLDQNKCAINSRSEVKIESEVIKGIVRPVPIIGSNMPSVMNANFAIKLWELGALGVLHRAHKDRSTYYKEVEKVANNCQTVCASIGINDDAFDLFCELRRHGMNCVFIDVAHGWQERAITLVRDIRETYPEIKIVVGNFINPNAFVDFTIQYIDKMSPLIDAFKIGIGQSQVCETAITAGCGMGQLSAVLRCQELARHLRIPIISDGGISSPHHFVKALAAGANSVMMGRVLAMCHESAAETVWINNVTHKESSTDPALLNGFISPKKKYYGTMSRLSQESWHGEVKNDCPEGKVTYLDIGEPVNDLLKRYVGALRSGISYAGGRDILSFQQNATFILS